MEAHSGCVAGSLRGGWPRARTCEHVARGGFAGSVVSQENSDLPLVQIHGQSLDRYVFILSRVIHLCGEFSV